MSNRHLIIMVKEPRAGRVKTRLGAEIGMTDAAWWFRHQSARVIRRLDDRRWRLWLGVSPDTAVNGRAWPAHLPRIAQGGGDLGARMRQLLDTPPTGPTLVVGADIPAIAPTHIECAFRALGRYDAVFGPATDGGYWLIGLKRTTPPPPTFLRHVRWSSEHAMADSIASLPGYRIALADTLQDIDTAGDLSA